MSVFWRSVTVLFLVLTTLVSPLGPAFAAQGPPEELPGNSVGFVDEFIVRFEPTVNAMERLQSLGIDVDIDPTTGRRDCFPIVNACAVPGPAARAHGLEHLPDVTAFDQVKEYEAFPDFKAVPLSESRSTASPASDVSLSAYTPNDAFYWRQWAPQNTNVDDVWSYTRGDSDQVVLMVLDTGLEYRFIEGTDPNTDDEFRISRIHGNLDLLNMGYDAVDQDWWAQDGHGHGTWTTGIAAATGDNGVGIAGVTWDLIEIYPIRMIDDNGYFNDTYILRALDWAYFVTNGSSKDYVLNASWGISCGVNGTDCVSQTLKDALYRLNSQRNVRMFAATGNLYHVYDAVSIAYLNWRSSWPASSNYSVGVGGNEPDNDRWVWGDEANERDGSLAASMFDLDPAVAQEDWCADGGGSATKYRDFNGNGASDTYENPSIVAPSWYVAGPVGRNTWLGQQVGSDYMLGSGTSAASPMASGVAALPWSRHRNWNDIDAWFALRDSAVDMAKSTYSEPFSCGAPWTPPYGGPDQEAPGWDDATGWGRLDAWTAFANSGY